ncbi:MULTISPECIES: HEXXH motif-containing putative peptide modification protein [unclassified Microcoleus]|uniref:aKG-HExxH-type peptide beta-hydroxylase n=1 Tax=unclassified Microcoleus TaxID=2642155 RepID=UPI0025D65A94|nr:MULTISPECIES: HEXXH motif-containing putative peptide modification protein [unclassified Microcoleus]
MKIDLDINTVKNLVSPTGASDPLVKVIYLAEYHKTLLRLSNLSQKLQSESPKLIDNYTNFSQSFELVKLFSKNAQRKILRYPYFSVWLDTAWQLVNRKAHILFPEMHIKFHLESFPKFILAMAQYDNIENLECFLYTDHAGIIAIPGTGIYLQHPQYIAFQRLRFVTTTNAGFNVYTDGNQNLEMIQNEIPHLNNGIELNSFDSDLRLGGRYDLNFEELTPTSTIKWLSSLEEAWFWIDSCSSLLASEILMGVQSLVPVHSHAIDVHRSQTFREIPGLLVLSWMSDTSVIVEALVHEYHHHKLNALLNLDPIIVKGSPEAIYYSPWRDDPRPLSGILQGIYVFQAVLEFGHKILKIDIPLLQEKRLQQRVYTAKEQLLTALKVLKTNAEFSLIGQGLIEAIEKNIDRVEPEISQTEKQLIDVRLKEHLQKWEAANPNLIETEMFQIQISVDLVKNDNNTILNQSCEWLGFTPNIDLRPLTYLRQPFDPILETLVAIYHDRGLKELEDILKETLLGDSILLDLICGHTAYLNQDYHKAARFYQSCLEQYPNAPYFWQCFMFALRHLNLLEDYELILLNLDKLVANSLDIKRLIRQNSNSENKVQMMVKLVQTLIS